MFGPLHVVGDDEIKLAIAIIIDPGRTGGKLIRSPKPGNRCDILKGAVAVVAEEVTLAKRGDENVVEAVVIVITDGHAQTIHRNAEARFAGHVGERAVVIVVIKLRGGGAALRMADPVLAINEQNIGPAVVVIIDERATGAHGFGQPLLAEGAVIVREADTRL